jgi:CheY-like chemotaxis protein
MTVLLVDDDPISLRLLAMTVGRLGLPFLAVTSGSAALATLDEHPEVALVITDLSMPGMSGLALFTTLRDDDRWATLPVVLCTGSADAVTVQEAIRTGVRHYIIKPIKPSVVAAKVSELLAAQLAAAVLAPPPSSPAAVAADPAPAPEDEPPANVETSPPTDPIPIAAEQAAVPDGVLPPSTEASDVKAPSSAADQAA